MNGHDQAQRQHEQNMRAAERAHDSVDQFIFKTNEAAISTGSLALRMSLLINGGAAIALISFVTHLPEYKMKAIAESITWFALGVFCSALGIACAYLTNYCTTAHANSMPKSYQHPYVSNGPQTRYWAISRNIFMVCSLLSGFASLILFLYGMVSVSAILR